MEPIIWYIIIVNGFVLLGQCLVSILFFYFSWKMNKNIEKAIENVDKRLEDKKLLAEIVKKLDAKYRGYQSKFMAKLNKVGKQIGVDDGGWMGIAAEALNHEEGIADFALRNINRINMQVQAGKQAEEEPMEGAPDWWTEEDELAVNSLIEERRKLHVEPEE